MKLLDAMRTINRAAASDRPVKTYALACGFTPLALETFLRAHLQQRRGDARIDLTTGSFGDLVGTIERARTSTTPLEGLAVAVEWADLDPRLGHRSAAALGQPGFDADVVDGVTRALDRLLGGIEAAAAALPVAVSLPTLPLPPVFHVTAGAASRAALRLRAAIGNFAAGLGELRNVRVVDAQHVDVLSPPPNRHDVTSELLHGFPYERAHAGVVGAALAALLHPASTKKGVITDLDNTLWRGIVGEIGVPSVCWGLEHGAQAHALYQQCLAALAHSGVLVGIASKNDPAVVAEALQRRDLLLSGDRVFPVHASWGAKSAAVAAILEMWNVGPDSVVFVDDSPLEIAEVQARFPEVEGLLFDPDDAAATLRVIARLRELFGRDEVREEDRLRAASLRSAVTVRESASAADNEESFLSSLDADIVFHLSSDAGDARALELVNKTNQFNLNGHRWTPAEWTAALSRSGSFLLTVAYRDKFGPLGKIAVVTGRVADEAVHVEQWVMSCRAFSRRIEQQTLRALFEMFDVDEVVLDYAPTPRNGPLQEFLAAASGATVGDAGLVALTRQAVRSRSPALHHACTYEGRNAAAGASSDVDRRAPGAAV